MKPLDPNLDRELLSHASHLRRLARRLVLDEERADEVVQRTWLAALRVRPEAGRGLRAWLAAAARRCAWALTREELERRTRTEEAARRRSSQPDSLDPEEQAERSEAVRALLLALGELEEPYGSAVLMRYIEGLEPTEIARRTETPVATIRSRIHRGRERLREKLSVRGSSGLWAIAILPSLIDPLPSIAAASAASQVIPGASIVGKKIGLVCGVLAVALTCVFAWKQFDPGTEDEVTKNKPLSSGKSSEARRAHLQDRRAANSVANETLRDEQRLPTRTQALATTWDLSGRVVDERGDGIANASITVDLFRGASRSRSSTRADSAGRFRLAGLRIGEGALLRAGAVGHAPSYRSIAANREGIRTVGDITLSTGAQIEGIVVDADGKPIPGAMINPRLRDHVSLNLQWLNAPTANAAASFPEIEPRRSDSEGRFALSDLPAGEWAISARAPNKRTATLRSLRLESGGVRTDLRLVLMSGATIRGRVLDHASGTPVAKAQIRARAGFMERGQSSDQRASTDENGVFELAGLESIPYTVTAVAKGQMQGVLFDVDPEGAPIDFRLPRAAQVRGVVLDAKSGMPVEDFEVRVSRPLRLGATGAPLAPTLYGDVAAGALGMEPASTNQSKSDSYDGLFLAQDLDVPRIEIQVVAPGYAPHVSGRLQLVAGETLEHEVTLRLESSIRGRVTDSEGRGISGADVEIAKLEDRSRSDSGEGAVIRIFRPAFASLDRVGGMADARVRSTTSNSDGFYEIRGLQAGRWSLRARRAGWTPYSPESLQINDGETKTYDLSLQRGGSVEGRVVDEGSGAALPHSGVSVVLRRPTSDDPHAASFGEERRTVSDEAGRFFFDGVAAGEWVVGIAAKRSSSGSSRPGGPKAEQALSVSEGQFVQITLTTPAPTRFSGLVVEAGRQVPGVLVKLQFEGDEFSPQNQETTTDDWGEFQFEGLSAGRYLVSLRTPNSSVASEEEFSIAIGEERFETLSLPTSSVSGRIIDADSESPIEGMFVSLIELIEGKPKPQPFALRVGVSSNGGGAEVSTARLGDAKGRVRSDAEGRFAIQHVPAGDYLLRVEGRGMIRKSQRVLVKAKQAIENRNFKVMEGRSLEVKLAGIPDRYLAIVGLKSLDRPDDEVERKTSSGSPLRFGGLEPGKYRLSLQPVSLGGGAGADAPQSLRRPIEIVEDEDFEITLDASPR